MPLLRTLHGSVDPVDGPDLDQTDFEGCESPNGQREIYGIAFLILAFGCAHRRPDHPKQSRLENVLFMVDH